MTTVPRNPRSLLQESARAENGAREDPGERGDALYSDRAAKSLEWLMREERLYQILQSETREPAARLFRGAHHAMVAAGIGIMLADTVAAWRHLYRNALDAGFQVVCAFFVAEYVLRLVAAPAAPGAEHRRRWRARLAWATSLGGVFDFLGVLPAVLAVVVDPRYASLFAFIWAFKLVRYSPGLASLRRRGGSRRARGSWRA